jgi:hypothetical protein
VGVVVPTTAVPMAAAKAEEDCALAAEDIPAARVFRASGQPRHDRGVVPRMMGLVVRLIVRTPIPGTSGADPLTRMVRGTQMARSDEDWVPPIREQ